MAIGVTGVAPEPTDRAVARVLAGGLDDRRDATGTATTPLTIAHGVTYQKPARVEIDPNVRVRGNQTFSTFEDCDRIPAVGEPVIVYESEAAIEGPAVVTGLDEGKRLVYLDVDWSSLTCRTCRDEGFACESHPERPWEGAAAPPVGCDCGAPGIPCPTCCDPIPQDGTHSITDAFTPRHLRT